MDLTWRDDYCKYQLEMCADCIPEILGDLVKSLVISLDCDHNRDLNRKLNAYDNVNGYAKKAFGGIFLKRIKVTNEFRRRIIRCAKKQIRYMTILHRDALPEHYA